MSEVLSVQSRETRGKRNARRLRRGGTVPAILYGHGHEAMSLAVAAEQLHAVIRHGTRVVDLEGAVSDKAFVRELQWDPYGIEVLHLDLTRVSADDQVEVEVHVELRGEAPGVKEGGVVTQFAHQVEIRCPVVAIPEKLTMRIGRLALGESMTVGQIELPPGVTLLTAPETVVVQCALPKAEEEAALVGEGAEPEVIGRKAEDEEEEE